MMSKIDALAEACARATPGPWTVTPPPWARDGCTVTTGSGDPHGEYIVAVTDAPTIPEDLDEDRSEQREADADYIARADPATVDLLIQVYRAARTYTIEHFGDQAVTLELAIQKVEALG